MIFLSKLCFVFAVLLALVFLLTFVAYIRNYNALSRAMRNTNALQRVLASLERDHLVSVMAIPVCGSFILALILTILGFLFKVFA